MVLSYCRIQLSLVVTRPFLKVYSDVLLDWKVSETKVEIFEKLLTIVV